LGAAVSHARRDLAEKVTMETDVAIIGAGPAGSAAAIGLAQRGYEVALIDKKIFPREKPCGDFVNPINWPVLRELGVEDRVLAQPHAEVSGFRITTAAGHDAAAQFTSASQERAIGLGIRRAHLDQVLLERAVESGVTVRQGKRVDSLSRTAHGWRIECFEESWFARILIGADGRNSWVAQRLGMNGAASTGGRAIGFQIRLRLSNPVTTARRRENNAPAPLLSFSAQRESLHHSNSLARVGPRQSLGMTTWSARAKEPVITSSNVEIHLFPGGYAGVVGLGDGTINLGFAIDRRKLPRENNFDFLFFEALPRNPYLNDLLLRSEGASGLRSAYPVHFPERRCYGEALLLIGDAARVSEPVTGEGIYFAMRSGLIAAETVDQALRNDDRSAARLRNYSENCRRAFRSRSLLNSLIRFAVYRPAVLDPFIRLSAKNDRMLNSLVGFVCAPEAAR
jgi:flavin-dependent dehydrogenase